MTDADPSIISLDIETYGAVRFTEDGKPLPKQKYFHPKKSHYWQSLQKKDLVATAAVTVAAHDPRVNGQWSCESVSQLEPGETIVFNLSLSTHKFIFLTWLQHADTIVGSNLLFDLLYLRYIGIEYKQVLDSRKTYIDTTVAAYLRSELSSSRSLKKLGPLLGKFTYEKTLQDFRYSNPSDKELHKYNAEDTHNTLVILSELAKRMPSKTDKLSSSCINHYSNSLFSVVQMSEAGIPFSSLALEQLKEELEEQLVISKQGAESCGLTMSGKGSARSKDQFINDAITFIERNSDSKIMDQLELTPKSKKVSFTKKNRVLLTKSLPTGINCHTIKDGLRHADLFLEAQKTLSAYVFPLLLHKRNDVSNVKSSLIPWNRISYRKTESHLSHSMFKEVTSQSSLTSLNNSSNYCLKTESPPQKFLGTHCNVFENIKKTLTLNSDPTPPQLRNRFDTNRKIGTADCAAYPGWYITPSRLKNDSGSDGGTIQGRITCKDPHAQTFPKIIKECLASRHLDGVILGLDLSQIELRVAAMLSGEQSMIDAYQDDRDLHAERSRTLWPDYDEAPEQASSRRQVGKMMNFADLFLSSARTMAEQVFEKSKGQINLPLSIFQEVVKTRKEIRPQLNRWQQGLLCQAKEIGRIDLPITGQSRTFSSVAEQRSEIVNFPVQTTASNVMMQIQRVFMDLLPNPDLKPEAPRVFLQVFDAVYLDLKKGDVPKVIKCFQEAIRIVSEEREGYWYQVAKHQGRSVLPLKFDSEILETRSAKREKKNHGIHTRQSHRTAAPENSEAT